MEQPQAFTCPYCGRMGYTEMSLQEHVAADHTETSTEVVRSCPPQNCPVQHYLPQFTGPLSPPSPPDLPHMCGAARRRPEPRD